MISTCLPWYRPNIWAIKKMRLLPCLFWPFGRYKFTKLHGQEVGRKVTYEWLLIRKKNRLLTERERSPSDLKCGSGAWCWTWEGVGQTDSQAHHQPYRIRIHSDYLPAPQVTHMQLKCKGTSNAFRIITSSIIATVYLALTLCWYCSSCELPHCDFVKKTLL